MGASVLLGACGGNGSGNGKDVSGEVKGDGSSTVGPIVEKLNEKFAKDYPDVTVSSGTSGTGGGFENSSLEKQISQMLQDRLKMKKKN